MDSHPTFLLRTFLVCLLFWSIFNQWALLNIFSNENLADGVGAFEGMFKSFYESWRSFANAFAGGEENDEENIVNGKELVKPINGGTNTGNYFFSDNAVMRIYGDNSMCANYLTDIERVWRYLMLACLGLLSGDIVGYLLLITL